MKLLFNLFINIYIKRISSLFYALTLILTLIYFDNQYKIESHNKFHFSYGNIVNSYKSIRLPDLDDTVLSTELIPVFLSQFHKSYVKENDVNLKLDLNIKNHVKLTDSSFIIISETTSDFKDIHFINYLSNFEIFLKKIIIGELLKYYEISKFNKKTKLNDFYNTLKELDSKGLLNSSIQLDAKLPDGVIIFNKLNSPNYNYSANESFNENNFSYDFNFIDINFKNYSNFYNYELIVQDNSSQKNKIKLSLIIFFILLITIHPIIINSVNTYVAKIRK